MNLNTDAMLVNLHINAWSGRRYDRKASDIVAAHHDASTSAGRYNKLLLPKDAFAELTSTSGEARKTHSTQTLPWDDKGTRLLTIENYDHYTELMDRICEKLVRERRRFIENYDENIRRARIDLGKLFRVEDYPPADSLPDRFAIRYTIDPIPDSNHFIARLANRDTSRIRHDIERRIQEKLSEASADLYQRIGQAVAHVSERLREDEEGKPLIFRNSLIENLRELVDVAPRLNIFDDENLTRLCNEIKTRIANVEPDALRPTGDFEAGTRARVKGAADDLLQQFAGYFGSPDDSAREAA